MEPIDLPTSPSPGASDQNPPLLSYRNQHFDAPHPNYPESVGLRLDSTVQRQLMVSPHPYVWLESVVFLRIIQAPPTDCLPYCKAVSQAPISQLSKNLQSSRGRQAKLADTIEAPIAPSTPTFKSPRLRACPSTS